MFSEIIKFIKLKFKKFLSTIFSMSIFKMIGKFFLKLYKRRKYFYEIINQN